MRLIIALPKYILSYPLLFAKSMVDDEVCCELRPVYDQTVMNERRIKDGVVCSKMDGRTDVQLRKASVSRGSTKVLMVEFMQQGTIISGTYYKTSPEIVCGHSEQKARNADMRCSARP
jgi:hypothetical protein